MDQTLTTIITGKRPAVGGIDLLAPPYSKIENYQRERRPLLTSVPGFDARP